MILFSRTEKSFEVSLIRDLIDINLVLFLKKERILHFSLTGRNNPFNLHLDSNGNHGHSSLVIPNRPRSVFLLKYCHQIIKDASTQYCVLIFFVI